MSRRDDADCPVCGSKLSGSRFTGFTCQRCKSHFSAKFIARMRKHAFKSLIDEHFTPKNTAEDKIESQVFLVPKNEVQEALEEAHESARRSVQHLEDLLNMTEQVPEAIETMANQVKAPTAKPKKQVKKKPVKKKPKKAKSRTVKKAKRRR